MSDMSLAKKASLARLMDQLERQIGDASQTSDSARVIAALGMKPGTSRGAQPKGKAAMVAGKVYFINIDEIAGKMGATFAALKPKLHDICQRELSEALKQDEVFERVDDSYYIFFHERTEIEAQLCCKFIARRIERLAHEHEGLESVGTGSVAATIEVDPDGLGQAFEDVIRELDEREGRARAAPAPTPDAGGSPGLQFVFRPMWNTRTGLVSTFLCQPVRFSPGKGQLVGEDVFANERNPGIRSAIDLLVADRVSEVLNNEGMEGGRAILGVPVSAFTLADPARSDQFVRTWIALDSKIAKLLLFEIYDLGQTPANFDLRRALDRLFRTSRAVVARVPLGLGPDDAKRLRALGISAAGVSLHGVGLTETKLMPRLLRFTEVTHAAGLRCYVHGIPTLSLTTFAACNGFDFIDGECVSSVQRFPGAAYPFSPERLYARLAAS